MAEQGGTVAGAVKIPVLVIEDDPGYAELIRFNLTKEGYAPTVKDSGEAGLESMGEIDPAVVLLDLVLPGKNGKGVLEEIRKVNLELPVVMMTASGSVEVAVECMKLGAYDFLIKPLEFRRLSVVLRNATQFRELRKRVNLLEEQLEERHGFEKIVAASPKTVRIVEQAARAARSDTDILIVGESGTGKEVLARAIHYRSARRKGPFVAINCGAIPEGLLESELFGHEKGAFTGASARRIGCFEEANGGTLFLDEIGEMRPDMQVRLLRALESREIRRVGSDRTIKVNVRVISATNKSLVQIQGGTTFRTDLFYRLAILVLEWPPLRDRVEDIPALAQHFLQEEIKRGVTKVQGLSKEVTHILLAYPWPGNVRELRNAIERALVFEESNLITKENLPPHILALALGDRQDGNWDDLGAENQSPKVMYAAHGNVLDPLTASVPQPLPSEEQAPPVLTAPREAPLATPSGLLYPPEGEILSMDEEEKRIIARALTISSGNVSETARRLGVHRSTLHRKIIRYGLETAETEGEPPSREPEEEV